MASAGSIFVDLLLRDASYNQGLNRARTSTRRFSGQVSGDVNRVQSAFAGVLSPVNNVSMAIAQLGGVVAGALSVQKIVQYSDTWRQLEGRLNIVASSMGDVGTQQEQLFEVAQRTRQPLEGILSFYTRLAQFIPEAERAQYDLLGVTESVSSALAITGETGASATAAMIQFTQAIGTNFEAAGQELRSLQEQAPRLTTALMNALGDGTQSLQQLKDAGLLTRESVLNALSGMGEEGQKLRKELEQVSLTVGQAFTRLDSAFLKFIGQSDVANAGTSSLAAGINFLANNLDLAANAAVAIATVMTTRVIVSFASATSQTIAYQLALARMSGVSASAAVSLTALAGAARLASSSLALLGGPLGVAIIAAIGLITFNTNEAEKAQNALNKEMNEFRTSTAGYITASDELKQKIRTDTQDRIDAYLKELEVVQTLVNTLANENQFFRGARVVGSFFGIDTSLNDAIDLSNSLKQAILEIKDVQDSFDNQPSVVPGSNGQLSKEAEKQLKELEKLYQSNQRYIEGVDQSTFRYNQTLNDLNTLLEAGKISQEEYSIALQTVKEEFDDASRKGKDFAVNIEEFSKRAASNIQDTFADFLFDPFEKGLDGMLLGFVDTVRKMIAEAQAARIAESLFGSSGGGGFFGDILGSLIGGASGYDPSVSAPPPKPSFFAADGGTFGPGQWGVVGEEGPELLYTGQTGATIIPNQAGKGGNVYNIDARGQDKGVVMRLEQALLALAGPGVIEQRVNNAQARGAI